MKKNTKTYQYINQIAKRIGEKFHPKKIILFGSYAYGTPHCDSDVDLMIIFARKRNLKKRYLEICQEIDPMLRPVDLLLRSVKDIKYRLKIGDCFINEILTDGKVLYEN